MGESVGAGGVVRSERLIGRMISVVMFGVGTMAGSVGGREIGNSVAGWGEKGLVTAWANGEMRSTEIVVERFLRTACRKRGLLRMTVFSRSVVGFGAAWWWIGIKIGLVGGKAIAKSQCRKTHELRDAGRQSIWGKRGRLFPFV